jgi:uncharacterized membrane protein
MKKLLLFLIIIVVSTFAIDIDEIDLNDIYYINGGFLDDRRVIVVQVNHTKGKVKVKADNGDTEWVYPSELLTRNENETTNTVMPFALIGGLIALASENNSNDRDDNSGYEIKVKNNCPVTMSLAIHYKSSANDEWETEYWWEFKPDEESALNANGNRLYTKHATLYYYAKGTYDSDYEIDGYTKYYLDGKNYWLKELVDESGTSDIVLNCN